MDDDALHRIDRRTASTDDAVHKLAEILEEMRADGRRHTQAIEDQRLAADQWNLRQERITQEMLASWQEITASIREWRYEGVAEARAQRAALFSILDQLKGQRPAAA